MRRHEQAVLGFRLAAAMMVLAAEALAQQQRANRQILVSIPDRKLALIENGEVLRTYPVAVGAPHSPSPEGTFQIAQRVVNPTWYHPGKVVPAGPRNPLGPRWIGLNHKGYGIHGTNSPRSIGRPASHGCIRMRNDDVRQLFDLVAVGDTVELHGERDAATERIFGPAPVTVAAAAVNRPMGD